LFRVPSFWEEKKRKPIPMKVKQEVFKRAKGRCENPKCRKPLKWRDKGPGKIPGVFHHYRNPSITPTSKTVVFLCPDCHSIAHEYKTVTKRDLFGVFSQKERKIVRKKFGATKKKTRKKTTKRKRKTTRRKSPEERMLDLLIG